MVTIKLLQLCVDDDDGAVETIVAFATCGVVRTEYSSSEAIIP